MKKLTQTQEAELKALAKNFQADFEQAVTNPDVIKRVDNFALVMSRSPKLRKQVEAIIVKDGFHPIQVLALGFVLGVELDGSGRRLARMSRVERRAIIAAIA